MFIRLVSDIHLDFAKWYPTAMPEDKETILVIAGDIWSRGNLRKTEWLRKISAQFANVILVLGNHDFYWCNLSSEAQKTKNYIAENFSNVSLLENNIVYIGDVKFIGAVLWTDFGGADPLARFNAERGMSDFHYIKTGKEYRKIKSEDILVEHKRSRKFIFDNTYRDYNGQMVVVVTHHAPTHQSISAEYIGDPLNPAYYSNLGEMILNSQIDYWFHGHVHHSVEYGIGDCVVMANPRGYCGDNLNFDENWRIEIGQYKQEYTA